MRCRANTKRATFLWPFMVLASASVSVVAAGPADGAPATACLRLDSRPAVTVSPGCTKFVHLRNSCEVPVVAEVRRTQRLFSGTLHDVFPVVVPAGGDQSLGCAWWRGAMAPAEHQLLAARFLVAPIASDLSGTESTRSGASDRHDR